MIYTNEFMEPQKVKAARDYSVQCLYFRARTCCGFNMPFKVWVRNPVPKQYHGELELP